MTEIKRGRNESFESMLRRAKRELQRSGRALQVKKVQFLIPKKSKGVRRKQRVAYLQKVQRTDYLRKIGKLPPEEETAQRSHR